MKKPYNVFIESSSKKEDLKKYCFDIGCKCYISGCGNGYYIQVDATPIERIKINYYLIKNS